MYFDGIWNRRENIKTMSLKNAFWHYLKRFGIVEKHEKNLSKECILTEFETIWNCRKKWKQAW